MAVTTNVVNIIVKVNENVKKQLAPVNKLLGTINSASMKARNALMGVGFGLLFIGMAIKNVAQRSITSILKTFTAVTEGTLYYNQTVGKLTAAFEYLKFSIADAFLGSEAGQALVDSLVQIFDYISSLPAETLQFIAIFLLAVFVGASLAVILGQVALALLAISSLAAILGIGLFGAALAVGLILLGLLLIVGAVVAAKLGLTEVSGMFLGILAIVILIGIALAIAFGAPIVIIGLLVAAFIGLILYIKNAGKEFELGFLKAIDAVGRAIMTVIIKPINYAIRAFNNLFGTNFGELKLVSDTDLTRRISALQAEVDAERMAEGPRLSVKEELQARTGEFAEGAKTMMVDQMNITIPGVQNAEDVPSAISDTDLFNVGAGT
jgi:hypothetical protein